MGNFRKLAHLEEQLGESRWAELIDPRNTGVFKAVCNRILQRKLNLPNEMAIGVRAYEILFYLEVDEMSVSGKNVAKRAANLGAELGEDDCRYILGHYEEIPRALLHKVTFFFTGWRHPEYPDCFAITRWNGSRLVQDWFRPIDDCGEFGRLLRRIKK